VLTRTARRLPGGRCAALPLCAWAAVLALAGLCVRPARAAAGTGSPAESTAAGAAADAREQELPPPPLPRFSEGDLLYVADAATFPRADSLSRVEFYVRVGNDQLRFRPDSLGRLGAQVQVDLSLYPLRGGTVLRWSRPSRLAAADSETAASARERQVLQWSQALEPGDYVAELSLSDMQAPKKTILGMIRGDHRQGQLRAMLKVRRFAPDSLELSDLEFAESFAPPDSSVFRKPRVTVYPNPGRRYGNPGNDLRVFVAGHLPAGAPPQEVRLVWEVFDRGGQRARLWSDTLQAPGWFDRGQVLRLGALAAGRYRLRLTVNPPAGPPRAVESAFDMAWSSEAALEGSFAALTDQAELLFNDEELDKFEDMSPGEQESYWQQYWARRRNGPEAAMGDPLAEFQYRIQVANQTFGGSQKGIQTDRGRIYVRYGEPDEIQQRVMPVGGETLTDIGTDLTLQGDEIKGRTLEQPGGRMVGDTRSYEIWDYDLHGRMIFGTLARQARHGSHMRFIFVDATGVGDYVLKYSSE